MQEEITGIYTKKEEISSIIKSIKDFKFEELIKTDHFEFSVMQKNTEINLLKKTFTNFNSIEMIQKRKHKNKNINYDFYYLLGDGTYVLYAIILGKSKPILINAFHVKRDFNQFKKKLINVYKD